MYRFGLSAIIFFVLLEDLQALAVRRIVCENKSIMIKSMTCLLIMANTVSCSLLKFWVILYRQKSKYCSIDAACVDPDQTAAYVDPDQIAAIIILIRLLLV